MAEKDPRHEMATLSASTGAAASSATHAQHPKPDFDAQPGSGKFFVVNGLEV